MSDTVKLVVEITKQSIESIKELKEKGVVWIDIEWLNPILDGVPLSETLGKIKGEIESDGAYYQEIGEKERANAYLEVLSTIDKYIGKTESEGT